MIKFTEDLVRGGPFWVAPAHIRALTQIGTKEGGFITAIWTGGTTFQVSESLESVASRVSLALQAEHSTAGGYRNG